MGRLISIVDPIARSLVSGIVGRKIGAASVITATSSGVSIPVNELYGQDLNTNGQQILVAFGSATSIPTVSDAFLYAATTDFGQRVLGTPPGATTLWIWTLGDDWIVDRQQVDLPQYGGAPGSLYYPGPTTSRVKQQVQIDPVDMSVESYPATLIMRVRPSNLGNLLSLATVCAGPAGSGAGEGTEDGGIRLTRNGSNFCQCKAWQDGASGKTATLSANTTPIDTWHLVAGTRSADEKTHIASVDSTNGWQTVTNAAADTGGTDPIYSYLILGADADVGTAAWSNVMYGYVGETALVTGWSDANGPTQTQMEAIYNTSLPLATAIEQVEPGAKIHAYLSTQENDPHLEMVGGRKLERVADAGDNEGKWTSQNFSHGTYARVAPNRLAGGRKSGQPGSVNWASNAAGERVTREVELAETIDTDTVGSVAIILRHKVPVTGDAANFLCGLMPSSYATANVNSTLLVYRIGTDSFYGRYEGSTGTSRNSEVVSVNNEWVLGQVCLNNSDLKGYTSAVDSTGYSAAAATAATTSGSTYNFIGLGKAPAAGFPWHTEAWIGEVCVISGMTSTGLTQAQMEAIYASNLPLDEAILEADSNVTIHAHMPFQSDDPWLERISGNQAAVYDGDGNKALWTTDSMTTARKYTYTPELYGGTKGSLYWASNATNEQVRRELRLAEPVDTDVVGSVAFIARYKTPSSVGTTTAYVGELSALGAVDTGRASNIMMARTWTSAPEGYGWFGNATTANQQKRVASLDDEWVLQQNCYDVVGNSGIVSTVTSAGYTTGNGGTTLSANNPTFEYLTLGNNRYLGGSAGPRVGWIDSICIISGMTSSGLTQTQLEAVYASDLPLDEAILAQDSNVTIHAHMPCQEDRPWLDTVSMRDAEYYDGDVTKAVWSSESATTTESWEYPTQTLSYSGTATEMNPDYGRKATPFGSRVATAHALTADSGTTPDADSAPTSIIVAGTSRVGGGVGTATTIDAKSGIRTVTNYFAAPNALNSEDMDGFFVGSGATNDGGGQYTSNTTIGEYVNVPQILDPANLGTYRIRASLTTSVANQQVLFRQRQSGVLKDVNVTFGAAGTYEVISPSFEPDGTNNAIDWIIYMQRDAGNLPASLTLINIAVTAGSDPQEYVYTVSGEKATQAFTTENATSAAAAGGILTDATGSAITAESGLAYFTPITYKA